jgi:predicted nucleic acid-binding Zn ribbon protein
MTRFDLLENFIEDPEALIRRTGSKLKKLGIQATIAQSYKRM